MVLNGVSQHKTFANSLALLQDNHRIDHSRHTALYDISLSFLFGIIFILVLCSAFFSGSETSMFAINRYRIKHLMDNNHTGAKRINNLMQRPDRLIGTILIGNNLVNILASSLATVMAIRIFGDKGIAIATIGLTLIILIFAEITPKTIAALYPERIAYPASRLLKPLSALLAPLVVSVNFVSHCLLRLMDMDPKKTVDDDLNSDELKTLLGNSGTVISERHQQMLLNIFELDSTCVEDIMIQRGDMYAINLNDDIDTIKKHLENCAFTRIPVYENNEDNIIGILHIRNIAKLLCQKKLNKHMIRSMLRKPAFTPESTGLQKQLAHFQQQKRRISMVVDEYGQVVGLVTLEDILEEIVGEFTSNLIPLSQEIKQKNANSYEVSGSLSVRDINRMCQWSLPLSGPKTLNGLIVESLECFPDGNACIAINEYIIEIITIENDFVEQALITYCPASESDP